MPSFTKKSLLAVLAGAASVSAHGHVTQISVDGKTFPGFNPFTGGKAQPESVGWGTTANDNGFVLPAAFSTRDIACHKGSTNAQSSATVAAGSTITVTWDTWPGSHKGPVIDYLASCGAAGCKTVKAEALEFFKIDEAGLENGQWASDALMAAGMKWEVKIPASLKAGEYVLRHEMIGLHEADRGGAQFYPQCLNLVVTGSGADVPAGVLGTKLYQAEDPGVHFNLYTNPPPSSYPIPGPALAAFGSGSGNGSGSGSGGSTPTTTGAASSPTPTKGTGNGGSNGGGSDCTSSRRARRASRKARRDAQLAAKRA